ncbi:MAG: hypothetical protein FJ054_08585 [Cyanobacteria bacterium M_surface_10_m2_119]|nr:hypothetical protein [Cyanobacteria bacterium M_surface_10_m2_119]
MGSFDSRVVELAFDPAGSGITVGHANGIVRRWTTGGRLLGEIDTAIDTLKALAITPGGDVLAAGWYGAKRWNAQGRAQNALREEGAVEALQLLPEGNGAVLAGSHVDNVLEIRDLQGALLRTLHNHDHSSSPDGPLAVSPDGRVLVVADDNQLDRWDLPSATPTPPHSGVQGVR